MITKNIRRIITFLKSLWFHVYAGFPKSTQTQILDRFYICHQCEMYESNLQQCLMCGCNVNKKKIFMNKLAWADQKCPLDKWGKIQ